MSDFSKTSYATDISYQLPSDDQLNYLVNKLCDNIPTLNMASEPYDLTKDSSVASSTGSETGDNSDESKNDELSSEETPAKLSKSSKHSDKRSLFNNDLNIAIMQCSGSLELLSERRKQLEMLVQQQHSVPNFSYAPRLPDSPTRVDRLMYDIHRERCRIVGLTSALDKTIQSFSSKTTKDDLRKLLVSFGSSIVNVIKERQSEVIFTQTNGTMGDYDSSKGVLKLVELLGEVHRMNRAVHTALWCIEIKERRDQLKQRAEAGKGNTQRVDLRSSNQQGITVQNSCQSLKPTTIPSKRYSLPINRTSTGMLVKSSLQTSQWANQQPTNGYKILPQQNRTQKGIQLYTQEQKTETYQHFYSSLKQSS